MRKTIIATLLQLVMLMVFATVAYAAPTDAANLADVVAFSGDANDLGYDIYMIQVDADGKLCKKVEKVSGEEETTPAWPDESVPGATYNLEYMEIGGQFGFRTEDSMVEKCIDVYQLSETQVFECSVWAVGPAGPNPPRFEGRYIIYNVTPGNGIEVELECRIEAPWKLFLPADLTYALQSEDDIKYIIDGKSGYGKETFFSKLGEYGITEAGEAELFVSQQIVTGPMASVEGKLLLSIHGRDGQAPESTEAVVEKLGIAE